MTRCGQHLSHNATCFKSSIKYTCTFGTRVFCFGNLDDQTISFFKTHLGEGPVLLLLVELAVVQPNHCFNFFLIPERQMSLQEGRRWCHWHRFHRHPPRQWGSPATSRRHRRPRLCRHRRQPSLIPPVQERCLQRAIMQLSSSGSRSSGCGLWYNGRTGLLAGQEQVNNSYSLVRPRCGCNIAIAALSNNSPNYFE